MAWGGGPSARSGSTRSHLGFVFSQERHIPRGKGEKGGPKWNALKSVISLSTNEAEAGWWACQTRTFPAEERSRPSGGLSHSGCSCHGTLGVPDSAVRNNSPRLTVCHTGSLRAGLLSRRRRGAPSVEERIRDF
uniref:Uncharacterized protein n=1 Tax=Molossus molossus TaxID=27622 RepID=A0A7J8HII6_MOLMO|nr:hypothetical protein HJG59_011076 [Molossus molossus]